MGSIKMVNFGELSKADIIFTTSSAPESAVIRKATNSIISHTMLVSKYNYIIEAIAPTIREASWDDALKHAEATVAIVMRRKGLSNGADQDKVVEAARNFVKQNLPYDYYGAAGAGMSDSRRNQIIAGVGCSINPIAAVACMNEMRKIGDAVKDENADKAFFCSELVARAFTVAGFPIVDGKATFAHPNKVYISSWLEYIGHLVYTPPPSPNITPEQRRRNEQSGYRKG